MRYQSWIAVAVLLSQAVVAQAEVEKEFEGLGGNRVLLDKAKEFNAGQEVSVVQERLVPRRNRFEFAPEFSGTFGGDTYTRTQAAALNVHYHITPRWSVGLKYAYHFNNELTAEGKATARRAQDEFERDRNSPTAAVPIVSYAKTEMFGLLYWYPIYGKMNLLDKGIAHFDVYTMAGYGQVELNTGTAPSYTGGLGLGVWWTRHFSSRAEMRYQTYEAKYLEQSQRLDLAVASLQLGWLL